MGIFRASDPWAGATEGVRRALSHIRPGPHYSKLLASATCTKLKYESPYFKPTAWAHIGFPKQKVAVILVATHDTPRDTGLRESWEKLGWKCLIAKRQDIGATSQDKLTADLLEAMKGVAK